MCFADCMVSFTTSRRCCCGESHSRQCANEWMLFVETKIWISHSFHMSGNNLFIFLNYLKNVKSSVDIAKLILTFLWWGKRPRKRRLKEKIRVRGLALPNFEASCKATAIKTVWCRQRNRLDPRHTRESPENPHKESKAIFDKRTKAIQWRKDGPFGIQCWND